MKAERFGNTGMVKAIGSMRSVPCILAVKVWKIPLEPSLPASCPPQVTLKTFNTKDQTPQKKAGETTVSQAPTVGEHSKSESLLMTKESKSHPVLQRQTKKGLSLVPANTQFPSHHRSGNRLSLINVPKCKHRIFSINGAHMHLAIPAVFLGHFRKPPT